jgi:hypothetical protein
MRLAAVVAQLEFLEWTEAHHLRHSKFVGLREDQERPYSGYLAAPAISPNGRRVALTHDNHLEIYEIP